nr:RNA-directed DNA polymerase, eukaryota [Tanacetum cinerariifolium]
MGTHNKNSLQSEDDQTMRISKSDFVFNFPEGCIAKDLWKVCNDYGTVVDVFIPNNKSKGEALDIEDNVDSSFGRKRLCIKTKLPLSIFESFKEGPNDDRVSDVEEFSETNFRDNSSIPINHIDELEKQQCEDPFNIYSEAVGNLGGILCVWEATVFKKDYATILDNFVAIYGTWLPSNSKVLFVAIYAPHQISRKRLLWDYVSTLIDRWNGEVVVFGDFNEVWNIDERRGKRLSDVQASNLERRVSRDEIRLDV